MAARSAKSEWEFGELLPPSEGRRVLTVSELTTQLKRLLETEVGAVWISGEITNKRLQASGHCYFTLKDATAQINCVLFRGQTGIDRSLIEDGRKVLLHGGVTVYEPRGQYQLIVDAVEPQGLGVLRIAFERLKQKLQAEGLFAPERKRPIPAYPRRVGVVTSPTGAALRDVLHVVARRSPALELILVPCRVQGEGAAGEIAAAVSFLNQWSVTLPPRERLDAILITRGGGSLEDLWAFNEEIVARSIYDSALPVISAVGHEIDFTISDFVADMRAATPSAAAELLTEGVVAARRFLADISDRLAQLGRRHFAGSQDRLGHLTDLLGHMHPRRRLNEHWQELDDLDAALSRNARTALRGAEAAWQALAAAWMRLRPSRSVGLWRERASQLGRRLGEVTRLELSTRHQLLGSVGGRLRLLSPEQVLSRGYSITQDSITGKILRRAIDARPAQVIRTRLHQGDLRSVVEGPFGPSKP